MNTNEVKLGIVNDMAICIYLMVQIGLVANFKRNILERDRDVVTIEYPYQWL